MPIFPILGDRIAKSATLAKQTWTSTTCGILLALAGGAAAQTYDLPARYDRTGPDQNVFIEPDRTTAIIATLPAGQSTLEVISFSSDQQWAQINQGVGTGWIPSADLTRLAAPLDQGLPIRCYGVEPFWGVHLPAPFFAEFERPEHPELPFQITGTADQMGPGGRTRLWTFAGATANASLLVRHELCTDGMSDRTFAMSAAFTLVERTGAASLRLGCCNLTAP